MPNLLEESKRWKANVSGLILLDPQIQRDAANWHGNTSPDINDPPSDYFGSMPGADGSLVVTNGYGGTKDFPGGLVSHKKLPPRDAQGNLFQYVAMKIGFSWSKHVHDQIARLELDLKVCFRTRPNSQTKIRNVGNFSTQWNRDRKQWQIDNDPPAWIDSGYVVEEIAPDRHHTADFRFWYDPNPDDPRFSVTSIDLDDNPFSVPTDKQNVPAQNTNWEEVRSIQLQTENYKPGSSLVVFDLVQLGWSHEPIPVGMW
jgi:hypothetical protein